MMAAVSLYLVPSLSLALIRKLFKGINFLNNICNSYNAAMIKFMCQLSWATGYPDILSEVLGVPVRMFADEVSI